MTAVLGRGLVVGGPDRGRAGDGSAIGGDGAGSRRSVPSASPRSDPPAITGSSRPSSPRLRRLWILPAVVAVAGAVALVPTVGEDGPGPGEAEVRVEGVAAIVRADGEAQVVEDGSVRLGPGDVIEVTSGRARFALDGDVSFEGRSGPAVAGRSGTTVEMGSVPELVAGSLLVEAPAPITVRAAGSAVTVGPSGGPGVARLDRRLGLGIGTYGGAVAVDSAGQRASIVALHRMEVARPGSLERRDLPLEYAADDPWDRRFLADALLVDAQLGPLLDAFDAATGSAAATVDGLLRARPGLPRPDVTDLVGVAPTASAALVTAVLADLGPVGSFPTRVAAIDRFRDAGARWGLVSMDQRVAPDDLLAAVRAALDRLGPTGIVASSATDPDGSGEEEVASGVAASAPAGIEAEGTSGEVAPEPDPASAGGPAPAAGPGGGVPPDPGSGPGPGPGPDQPAAAPLPIPPVLPSLPPPGGSGPLGDVGETVGDLGGAIDEVTSGLGDVVDGLLATAGRVLGTEADPSTGGGLLGRSGG